MNNYSQEFYKKKQALYSSRRQWSRDKGRRFTKNIHTVSHYKTQKRKWNWPIFSKKVS